MSLRRVLKRSGQLLPGFAARAFLCAGMACTPARATSLARMDVAQLTSRAAVVARVRCLGSVEQGGRKGVWTITRFAVLEVWKGSAPAEVLVRLPGGRAGGVTVRVGGAPQFSAGEQVVLFLEPVRNDEMTITGWAEGTFRIVGEQRSAADAAEGAETIQDMAGSRVLDARTGHFSAGGTTRIPLAALRAAVEEAKRREP